MLVSCNYEKKIGGVGMVVEIDESKFGKRKYNRGKRVEGKWVFGGIERGTTNCFFKVVEDRTAEMLIEITKKYVEPGSNVLSDCWQSYTSLKNEGYTHYTVNHSKNFKDPVTWSVIKSQFRKQGTNKCKDQFDSYLGEYMFRRKYGSSGKALFTTFMNGIVDLYLPQTQDSKDDPKECERKLSVCKIAASLICKEVVLFVTSNCYKSDSKFDASPCHDKSKSNLLQTYVLSGIGQTCSKLALQIIAKAEYEHNTG
ncbi:hypothetical protein AVEN_146657-1 [Araneus ventricosus]|uniref:ISXO2-like transposase domain-containing protein n=1 Tax=Araneus ventricosus TaxID=182803 RepID=A0A4Y2KQF7_ARAVE|nr:hypothetical protein AVEN_146657-1 [Araneus ventricosus]